MCGENTLRFKLDDIGPDSRPTLLLHPTHEVRSEKARQRELHVVVPIERVHRIIAVYGGPRPGFQLDLPAFADASRCFEIEVRRVAFAVG